MSTVWYYMQRMRESGNGYISDTVGTGMSLFDQICYCIAIARTRRETGRSVLGVLSADCLYPSAALEGWNKRTKSAYEFVIKITCGLYTEDTPYRTLWDKLSGSTRSYHVRIKSTDSWLSLIKGLDGMLNDEGIGYRLFYAAEIPPLPGRTHKLADIMRRKRNYVELPKKEPFSFELADAHEPGCLFIHFWYDP